MMFPQVGENFDERRSVSISTAERGARALGTRTCALRFVCSKCGNRIVEVMPIFPRRAEWWETENN
jgi:hypothetical protein